MPHRLIPPDGFGMDGSFRLGSDYGLSPRGVTAFLYRRRLPKDGQERQSLRKLRSRGRNRSRPRHGLPLLGKCADAREQVERGEGEVDRGRNRSALLAAAVAVSDELGRAQSDRPQPFTEAFPNEKPW